MDRMNVLRFLPDKCRENPPKETPWQAGWRAGWDGIGWFTPNATFRVRIAAAVAAVVVIAKVLTERM